MNWRRFFERKRRDEDLARELESYLAHEADENLARGMSSEEAHHAAQRKFGNPTHVREVVYEMNSLHPIDAIRQDLKYSFRQLRLKPGFTLTAILSLALGIGANTAIFTLMDQIVLRLLPVHNPRELVQLEVTGGRYGSNTGDDSHTFSYPLYVAFRDRNPAFSGLTGQRVELASLTAGDRSEMASVGMVAGNFFQVLGVPAYLGRLLTADDDTARLAHPVAVLQYDFWRNRFGANAGIVGSTIRLNGAPFTVVGVSARDFTGTDVGVTTEIWVPVTMKPVITPTWDALDEERYTWFYLYGRLKPGITIDQARAAMRVLYRQRQQEELKSSYFQRLPAAKGRFLRQNFTLIPAARGQSWLRSMFAQPLIVLQWFVGVVLLIACTNVAGLLLARANARRREIAIRGALGASRGKILRQLFVESVLLAAAGGAAGLLLSSWMTKGLVRLLSFDPTSLSLSTTPDLRILLFAAGVTLLAALFFGLIPALQGSRAMPGATLREETGAVSGSHGHVRLRKVFVALQVGLSCLLLIGAGLFARTLHNLKSVDLGFKTENVLTFSVRPATVYDGNRRLQVYRTLLESLSALSGVRAVGANRERLLSGGSSDSTISMAGVGLQQGDPPWSYYNWVTPGYFDALGIPIKAGRDLRWSDWGGARKVCLVNQEFVDEYLGGANPIGRLIAQGEKKEPDTEIIGVFGNARYDEVRGKVPRQVFPSMDMKINFVAGINVYARIFGDPRQVMSQVRDQIRRVDSNLVISGMRTLDDQVNMSISNERLMAFLSTGFALLASLLAIVGLHGVLTFVVARRTREIGIRMALGAERGSVVRLVVKEMLAVILIGIAVGAAAALLCGRYVESQLFGIKAADVLVFVVAVSALLVASLGAAFMPAWRASRIDPIRALRYE